MHQEPASTCVLMVFCWIISLNQIYKSALSVLRNMGICLLRYHFGKVRLPVLVEGCGEEALPVCPISLLPLSLSGELQKVLCDERRQFVRRTAGHYDCHCTAVCMAGELLGIYYPACLLIQNSLFLIYLCCFDSCISIRKEEGATPLTGVRPPLAIE